MPSSNKEVPFKEHRAQAAKGNAYTEKLIDRDARRMKKATLKVQDFLKLAMDTKKRSNQPRSSSEVKL